MHRENEMGMNQTLKPIQEEISWGANSDEEIHVLNPMAAT